MQNRYTGGRGNTALYGIVPDKKERGDGFGLSDIQETAQQLGGDMVCYTENGYFILAVMLIPTVSQQVRSSDWRFSLL